VAWNISDLGSTATTQGKDRKPEVTGTFETLDHSDQPAGIKGLGETKVTGKKYGTDDPGITPEAGLGTNKRQPANDEEDAQSEASAWISRERREIERKRRAEAVELGAGGE